MTRFSVLFSQDQVASAQEEVRIARLKLEELERRLERVKERHREQIARSLTSKDPEERRKAESIRQWWSVDPVAVPSRARQ